MQSNQGAIGDELGQFDRIFNVFSGTLGVVVDILLILVFGLVLVAKPALYVTRILAQVPLEKKTVSQKLLLKLKIPFTAGLLGRYWI